jgi:hypothetical protein
MVFRVARHGWREAVDHHPAEDGKRAEQTVRCFSLGLAGNGGFSGRHRTPGHLPSGAECETPVQAMVFKSLRNHIYAETIGFVDGFSISYSNFQATVKRIYLKKNKYVDFAWMPNRTIGLLYHLFGPASCRISTF